MSEYVPRYPGVRWSMVYGSHAGPEEFAVAELQRQVQRFLPYVIALRAADEPAAGPDGHELWVGTPENHPGIAALAADGRATPPAEPQSYALWSGPHPADPKRKLVAVAGRDAEGVLYGVEDLCAQRLAPRWPEMADDRRKALDEVPAFSAVERPAIARRGIWTWGYVIYDYRRFLDHMARLRMNTLVVWNDCPPLNAPQVLAHARSRGIRVVLGFNWGWGRNLKLTDADHRRQIREDVLHTFRTQYAGLGMDGIYFQTLTEHTQLELDGRSTAELACDLVNDVAGRLLAEYPDLYIQFGLHAPSIGERYAELQSLDPRVTIMWEDAGVLPFAYDPVPEFTPELPPHSILNGLGTPEATRAYAQRLAAFRQPCEFAMVPKGWICLRWGHEFEHHGPFLLGERDEEYVRRRRRERQPRWDTVDRLWLRHYPLAAQFYCEVLDVSPERMLVAGLIEDGLFEDEIPLSVALFGETLWNPRRPDADILRRALSPYYRRPR